MLPSVCWDFFKVTVNDETKAICNLCGCIQSRGTIENRFTTSNMITHLKKQHRLVLTYYIFF